MDHSNRKTTTFTGTVYTFRLKILYIPPFYIKPWKECYIYQENSLWIFKNIHVQSLLAKRLTIEVGIPVHSLVSGRDEDPVVINFFTAFYVKPPDPHSPYMDPDKIKRQFI